MEGVFELPPEDSGLTLAEICVGDSGRHAAAAAPEVSKHEDLDLPPSVGDDDKLTRHVPGSSS